METKNLIFIGMAVIIGIVAGLLAGRYWFPYHAESFTQTSTVRLFAPDFKATANVSIIPKTRTIFKNDTLFSYEVNPINDRLQARIDSLIDEYAQDMKYSTQHDSTFFSPTNPSLMIKSHTDIDFYLKLLSFDVKQNIESFISDRDTVHVQVFPKYGFQTGTIIGTLGTILFEGILYLIFH